MNNIYIYIYTHFFFKKKKQIKKSRKYPGRVGIESKNSEKLSPQFTVPGQYPTKANTRRPVPPCPKMDPILYARSTQPGQDPGQTLTPQVPFPKTHPHSFAPRPFLPRARPFPDAIPLSPYLARARPEANSTQCHAKYQPPVLCARSILSKGMHQGKYQKPGANIPTPIFFTWFP